MSAPVGPTGCEGERARDRNVRVGASFAHTTSSLRFDGEADYDLTQQAALATLAGALGERTTLQLSLGAVLGGELSGERRSYDIEPGVVAGLVLAHRFLGAREHEPFVTTSMGYSMSFAGARERSGAREGSALSASDARLGALIGVTLWRTWVPYAAARFFAGPVLWEQDGLERTGSDRHHYAVGAGSTVMLNDRTSLTVDGTVLGERTLAFALSAAF